MENETYGRKVKRESYKIDRKIQEQVADSEAKIIGVLDAVKRKLDNRDILIAKILDTSSGIRRKPRPRITSFHILPRKHR